MDAWGLDCKHPVLVRWPRGLFNSPVGQNVVARPDGRSAKMLVNVTVHGSVGPVQVVISLESTVRDLMKAALEIYQKEKRRPLVTEIDLNCFQLHYSSFSLECLKQEEKVKNLGSRNFFLCHKPGSSSKSNVTCSKQANKIVQSPVLLTKLLNFLLRIAKGFIML